MKHVIKQRSKWFLVLGIAALFAGVLISSEKLLARERRVAPPHHAEPTTAPTDERDDKGRRVVYRKRNVVDFDSMLLEGDIKNPNEFYFVHRPEEKFGNLVKRRKNFHKEMLRDAVMIR